MCPLPAQDCGPEDYEKWSPPAPGVCLMGRNVTMERRRRSSDCFNGKEYERAETSFTLCPCDTVGSPLPTLTLHPCIGLVLVHVCTSCQSPPGSPAHHPPCFAAHILHTSNPDFIPGHC